MNLFIYAHQQLHVKKFMDIGDIKTK